MLNKLSIQDLTLHGKRILMRVDFNVPLNEERRITNDARIRAALPTIQYALDQGASVILMSHLGRPKGSVQPQYSLAPCAKCLSQLLDRPVLITQNCVGQEVENAASKLKPAEVLMLENLRFHRAEEHPEEDLFFAKNLSQLADIYVNDAFGTAHRVHSSTVTVAKYFPNYAAAGFLMNKEIETLGALLDNPERPFYAIIGGNKVSSKIGILKALIEKANGIIIGGGMAFTFLKAQGYDIGESLCEEAFIKTAQDILQTAKQENVKILLPCDIVAADNFHNDANTKTIAITEGIPQGYQGLDIGPKTREQILSELQLAKTVFWNGPLGVFEMPTFAKGTYAIAQALADLNATTVIGGGDSATAIKQAGVADQMTHISTGGGASLELIEQGQLPGIEALSERESVVNN